MAGIFTRKTLGAIIHDENLTPEERIDQIFSMYGRAIDDGYVTKSASQASIAAAVEEAKKNIEPPTVDVTKAPEYVELQNKLQKVEALSGDDFKGLKSKFRDDAWAKLDHSKPYAEQLEKFKADYPEYWEASAEPQPTAPVAQPVSSPVFSQGDGKSTESMTETEKFVSQFREGLGLTHKKGT